LIGFLLMPNSSMCRPFLDIKIAVVSECVIEENLRLGIMQIRVLRARFIPFQAL
jgi:hypothetical protein